MFLNISLSPFFKPMREPLHELLKFLNFSKIEQIGPFWVKSRFHPFFKTWVETFQKFFGLFAFWINFDYSLVNQVLYDVIKANHSRYRVHVEKLRNILLEPWVRSDDTQHLGRPLKFFYVKSVLFLLIYRFIDNFVIILVQRIETGRFYEQKRLKIRDLQLVLVEPSLEPLRHKKVSAEIFHVVLDIGPHLGHN